MGFWSTLGSIGALAAAPFTGGATAALLPAIGAGAGAIGDAIANHGDAAGDVGTVLGKDAAGAAQGRLQQGQIQNQYDRNALDFYNSGLKAPSTAASQAVRGALLQHLQDASINGLPSYIHVPQISGGLRPSALGTQGSQVGRALFGQAMGNLGNMKPLQQPTQTALPTPSAWDRIASTGGRVGSLLGALGPLFKPQQAGATGAQSTASGLGAYGFDPEEPLNADPNWWAALPGNGD